MKIIETLKEQFEALKKTNGFGYLCISNLGGIEVVINNSNDGVLYKYYNKIGYRWQEIKYTAKGRGYFTIYGKRYYLDNFMRGKM